METVKSLGRGLTCGSVLRAVFVSVRGSGWDLDVGVAFLDPREMPHAPGSLLDFPGTKGREAGSLWVREGERLVKVPRPSSIRGNSGLKSIIPGYCRC